MLSPGFESLSRSQFEIGSDSELLLKLKLKYKMISTTSVSAIDLINMSQGIAQLNLGYLGISVAILGVLGGVFIYFNVKPLKDTLDKQEDTINDLRKEAHSLLTESGIQTEKTLNDFKVSQSELLSVSLQQQKENTELETKNKIQEMERSLVEKIESVSDSKDEKLKELILSETTNRIAVLEKTSISANALLKADFDKKLLSLDQLISGLKSNIKDVQRDVKELKVYKYSKENKMGAIIYSIELLKDDIDEKRWSILNSLERLKGEIDGKVIDAEYIGRIEKELARIQDNPEYGVIISQIRKLYSENKTE